MTEIRHIDVRSVVTKTGLPVGDFAANPYVGCTHACRYCYACFMKRFTGHTEPWGDFLDVKHWPRIRDPGRYRGKDIFIGSVTDPYLPEEAEMTAISLLREMESRVPMQRYVDYIAGLDEPDDKGDLCAEALLSMGSEVVGPVLEALAGAHEAGKDIFADILSNYPGDERIYDLLIERFSRCTDRRALYASYLAKLGDDRALEALKAAAQESGVGYLDYVEIVNAIEALGGERPAEREFSGDPYYESLKRL